MGVEFSPCCVAACPAGYCLFSGTCRMAGSTPVCDCPPTQTGLRCETTIGVVTTAPGRSMFAINALTLDSKSGVKPCASGPCTNGGTCYDNVNSFVCACRPTFSGPTCATVLGVTASTSAPGKCSCTDQSIMHSMRCSLTLVSCKACDPVHRIHVQMEPHASIMATVSYAIVYHLGEASRVRFVEVA